jgi:hypothetical protein
MADKVIPILSRVMYLDNKELADVRDRKSLGTENDCWHLVDPAQYPDEVKAVICELAPNLRGHREIVVRETRYDVRVWPINQG